MWKFLHPVSRKERWLTLYWRNFALALFLCAVAGAAILLFLPAAAGIFLFGIYAIPSNSMIPVPHEPGLLYFAKFYHPFWIALAGTLGTAVAAFADYELVARAIRHPRMRNARDSRIFQWAIRWFNVRPFITVVIFSATPLPIYVVRILAPAAKYSITRYILALMVGRFPRFYAVAMLGYIFPIPTWILLVLFGVFVAAVLWKTMRTSGNEDEEPADEEFLEALIDDMIQPDPESSTEMPAKG